MRHVIVSREYPPAAYKPGGIGTYVSKMAYLLADSGEIVHVIAQRWRGAPKPIEELCSGRLIVHRIPLDDSIPETIREFGAAPAAATVAALARSLFPPQSFAWQAALLAESLIETEGIDVIEGQEWEAPLYFLQLRRALGLGPKRRPPCLVHLHSPTEFIYSHNEWDTSRAEYRQAARLEEYTITAADALLCPSNYLARQVAFRFRVPVENIEIIPYPLGEVPFQQRGPETWERGSILFIGRLEPRKGVLEWSKAAAKVACDDPTARFEFVGADTALTGRGGPTVRQVMTRSIPRELRHRFHFAGVQPHADLDNFLAQARAAVVPSRWENFPNTCIESMASGLPVIMTPTGGMVEMVEDGYTGWIAPSASSEGLAVALRRALDTPAPRLEAMGLAASAAIHRLCDNSVIVERHMELRRRVVAWGASGSLHMAPVLPWSTGREHGDRPVPRRTSQQGQGIALVVLAGRHEADLEDCAAAIERQTQAPATVAIVAEDPTIAAAWPTLGRMQTAGWQLVVQSGPTAARSVGLHAILNAGVDTLGVAFVDVDVHLRPKFVEAMQAVLHACDGIGIVSPWVQRMGRVPEVLAPPCPAFPYQWHVDDVATCAAMRIQAVLETDFHRTRLDSGFEARDLATAMMENGWIAVTYPALLCDRRWRHDSGLEQAMAIPGSVVRFLMQEGRENARRAAKLFARRSGRGELKASAMDKLKPTQLYRGLRGDAKPGV